MPRDLGVDLLRHGYRAIPRARERAADATTTAVSLLGRKALVVTGPEAARRFYDPTVIRRQGAVPRALSALLFGSGAIHGLDGEEHAHRKRLFLDLLDERTADRLEELVRADLRARLQQEAGRELRVFDLLVEVYGAAVLRWAGIADRHAVEISHRLARIVDGFGGAGVSYPRAWAARLWANRWARRRIRRARAHPSGSAEPVEVIAGWRDAAGDLLPERVAAVELLNVLRPAVAVAYLGAFGVVALDDHPEWIPRLAGTQAQELRRAFAHEVRRTFPFVPALAGRVREHAEWEGHHRLRSGGRVILDVPGTDTDEATWPDADRFDPARFVDRSIDPFELVPQGGGDPATGHRCPGEPATVRMIEATLEVFSSATWGVVERGHDLRRIPARERVAVVVGTSAMAQRR